MLTLRLNREDLKKRRACSKGLALFDLIKEMQDEIRTANGKQLRKSLKVEWSLLHQIWAATTWPEFMSWLITVGLAPCVNGAGADSTAQTPAPRAQLLVYGPPHTHPTKLS